MAGITWQGYPKPSDAVVDVGVIAVGGVVTAFGATVGGLKWDPKVTVRHIEWDGKSSEIAGLHRKIKVEASLSGKIKRGFAGLTQFEPGSSSDGSSTSASSSGNTITLLDLRTPWTSGMYLTDVNYLGRQQDGNIGLVHMPFAYVEKYSLVTKDNDKGEWDVSIVPVLSASETNINKVPFTYHVVDEA